MLIDPLNVLTIIRQIADEEILPRFNHLSVDDISEKGPGDVVTIADIEAERRLTADLTALLPDSQVVGEEGVSMNPDQAKALDSDRPVWVVDPVDGTQNFADGTPCFAVMVALCRNHTVEAAWIHDPINQTSIYAVKGQGAWEGDRRLPSPKPMEISDMYGSLSPKRTIDLNRRRAQGGAGIPNLIKRYRCVGREYMDLARGKLQFLRYGGKLMPWDHIPGVLIHRETGGYDAVIPAGIPYPVNSNLSTDTIMLAPNIKRWRELTTLLES